MYKIVGPNFESIALGLNGQIFVLLNPNMIFFLVNVRSSVLSTHLLMLFYLVMCNFS